MKSLKKKILKTKTKTKTPGLLWGCGLCIALQSKNHAKITNKYN